MLVAHLIGRVTGGARDFSLCWSGMSSRAGTAATALVKKSQLTGLCTYFISGLLLLIFEFCSKDQVVRDNEYKDLH